MLSVDDDDNSVAIKYYTVKYDVDGGNLDYDNSFIYREGDSVKTISAKPTKNEFAFDGWKYGDSTFEPNQSITDSINRKYDLKAIWEVDKVGDGDKPDGIPDKYQKKITFKVVNGTWENKTTADISFYVTLLDSNGKWSENGTARINIPTGMTANYGYENGKWDIEPTEVVSGTSESVYVYSFEKIPETKPQPATPDEKPKIKTVVQEKTVYKTQYVEPITLKTGDNLIFLGVLVGLCALGFTGTIIFGRKRNK